MKSIPKAMVVRVGCGRIIRWRSCDPGEIGATNWTRVHVFQDLPIDGVRWTLCGLEVPEYPYTEDIDAYVPDDAPRCRRCQKIGGSMV